MPPANRQTSPAVVGVRLPDRRLIFVEGAPSDLPPGATVRAMLDAQEITGTVSIPPALLVWRDPDARCAVFVEIVSLPASPIISPAEPPEALFLADLSAPDEGALAAMLGLARAELHRLTSAWDMAPAPGGEERRATAVSPPPPPDACPDSAVANRSPASPPPEARC